MRKCCFVIKITYNHNTPPKKYLSSDNSHFSKCTWKDCWERVAFEISERGTKFFVHFASPFLHLSRRRMRSRAVCYTYDNGYIRGCNLVFWKLQNPDQRHCNEYHIIPLHLQYLKMRCTLKDKFQLNISPKI